MNESLRARISAQIHKIESSRSLNAVLRTRTGRALAESAFHTGALSGKTILVKDNISIAGEPLTCGSRILEDYRAPYHATAVQRVIEAGGAITGQTNMDEFAMGSSNEYSAFGAVRNPYDATRVPGGSSGGSAAAVAAGLADLALGSDTGGSVRQPAAFCGLYGLKPTYGRVSRYGLVAFASSFDQIGPLAGSVQDLAGLFVTIAGPDPRDSTTAGCPVPALEGCLSGDPPRRIGILRSKLPGELEPQIRDRLERIVTYCRRNHIHLKDIEFPWWHSALSTYYILTMAEASSNLARYDGVRYGRSGEGAGYGERVRRIRTAGFGPEVKRRILLGTFILSGANHARYYQQALKVRGRIVRDFRHLFKSVDLLVLPTTPAPPFRLGAIRENPVAMHNSDIYTVPMNLAGIPALNVPAGFTEEGLPLGLQVAGPAFQEETILRFGRSLEQAEVF